MSKLGATLASVGSAALILVGGSQGTGPLIRAPSGPGKLAFVRYTSPSDDLYLMNADGTGQRRVIRGVSSSQAAWSPDGRKIAVTRPDKAGIYVISADGTGGHALTQMNVETNPAWSPDGRKIAFGAAFGAEDKIYVMNADGSQPRFLARGTAWAWSPDGRRVAYLQETLVPDSNGNDSIYRIYLIDSRGGRPRLFARYAGFAEGGFAWSPDGRRIAYAYGSEQASESGICIKNVRGGRARCPDSMSNGSEGTIYDPAWSPDGRKLVYTDDGRLGIVITSADGKRQRLQPGGLKSVGEASWSPDGREIAFVMDGIYVVSVDGTGLRRLTRSGGDRYPTWQPQPIRKP